jgi:hypothetical protein
MNDLVTSLIRTWTPIIVGQIAGYLAATGIDVDANAIAGLTAFLGALFSGLYYLVVRLIERKYPQAGILLGKAKLVEYSKAKAVK